MNDTNRSKSEDRIDLLITRMIDGEAGIDDYREFTRLADDRPELWRELALRQRDAFTLIAGVERHVAAADRVDLPRPSAVPEPPMREAIPYPRASSKYGGWLFASAGWAAAIAMLLLWSVGTPNFGSPPQPSHIQTAARITPDEQLRSYLQAPFVIGELDPVMDRLDELPDGRVAVVAVRRIQEVLFFDDDDPLPVDEHMHFTKDPAELRAVR